MQHGRRWDAHFRHHLGVGLQEFEVLQHRMVAEIDLAGDADALRLGLHALELNAVVVLIDLDIVEPVIKVEMPEHAAVLAIGRALQPNFLLLLDDLRDFLVLDLLQISCADLTLVALRARFGDRGGAQIAADMVGAKGGRGSFHGTVSSLSDRERGLPSTLAAASRLAQRSWDASHCRSSGPNKCRPKRQFSRQNAPKRRAQSIPLACDSSDFRPTIQPEAGRARGAPVASSLGGISMIKRVLMASAALALSAALAQAQEVK